MAVPPARRALCAARCHALLPAPGTPGT
jgi:hypothetical protein